MSIEAETPLARRSWLALAAVAGWAAAVYAAYLIGYLR
jgi:hypothetical protein